MAHEDQPRKDPYTLASDDADQPPGRAPAPGRGAKAPPPYGVSEGFDRGLGDIDSCPHCGAPMTAGDEVLCLRCGFDLAANRVVRTATGVDVAEAAAADEERAKTPMSRPGRGGLVGPATLAGVCIVIMSIAYLAGAASIFPSREGRFLRENWRQSDDPEIQYGLDSPRFPDRLRGLAGYYLSIGVWTVGGCAGLLVAARHSRRPAGDLQLAAVRMLGVVSAMSLVTLLVEHDARFIEFLLELVGQAIVFVSLVFWFFRMTFDEAKVMAGVAIGLNLAIFLVGAGVRAFI
jgi:hypothetical protein